MKFNGGVDEAAGAWTNSLNWLRFELDPDQGTGFTPDFWILVGYLNKLSMMELNSPADKTPSQYVHLQQSWHRTRPLSGVDLTPAACISSTSIASQQRGCIHSINAKISTTNYPGFQSGLSDKSRSRCLPDLSQNAGFIHFAKFCKNIGWWLWEILINQLQSAMVRKIDRESI